VKPRTRLLVNLAAVGVLAVVTVGWVLTEVVGTGITERPFTVTADFDSSGGVFTNQEVTYRGVLVGKVGELRLNNDGGVSIDLLIDPEWEGEIPSNSVAVVQSKSAVGEQYVNLIPEGSSGEMLSDGARIGRANTELPVDFQELLTSLDRVLADVDPARTRRVIENLADGLSGRDEDIATVLESLGRLADAFADVAPEQERLLANAPRAGAEFLRTKDEFSAAISAADEVLAGIGDEPEELRALLVANDRLAREALNLLARHSENLAGGIDALSEFVSFQLENERELIDKTLRYVPAFLHAVEDASIPWTSPDGRDFYRIRIGLVYDNVRSSWPCKYRLPENWERFPHQRKPRPPKTSARCPQGSAENAAADAAAESLVTALEDWAREHPDVITSGDNIALPLSDDEESGFIWPVEGEVTSGYGPRYGGMHTGIDIDADTGTPVAASAAGKVILSAVYFGYGNSIMIDHGDGLVTLYGHLSAQTVAAGDIVEQGAVVGLVGCSGDCSGDHLHFEVRVNEEPVPPMPYLRGAQFVDSSETAEGVAWTPYARKPLPAPR
jgi:phospholipid/cholesterol/gamma-HCH transport system substrate-binding protein